MTRKQLTANQIIAGARAYSHNASRRAHQLSGPKRVRVMRGPVGDAALNDGIDSSCEHCGYQLCNCGPCATCGEVPYYCSGTHAYEPPKPSARALDNLPADPARTCPCDGGYACSYHPHGKPAEPSPAGGRDPYEAAGHPWARVGMRVRFIGDGEETTVVEPTRDFDRAHFVMVDGDEIGYGLSLVEPAPSPVSEAPTAESDEAVLMRCGWGQRDRFFERDRMVIFAASSPAFRGQWRYGVAGESEGSYAPTLLQAACAALGITLEIADPNGSEFFSGCYRAIAPNAGEYEGALVTATGDRIRDIETAARAALLAYASRGKP
jgi:hypothetical protein